MADVPYIWFRGKRMTPAFRDAILAAEQRAGRQFTLTQGGFNAGGVAASAGTHDGDAGDWSIRGLNRDRVAAMIEALRWAGIAAWLRTANVPLWETRAQYFSSTHVHGVPNGWGLPSAGARAQADAYRRGRDGLRANLPDIGPGHVKTWYSQTTPRKPITPGLPPAGVDTRTDLERLLDSMDEAELRKIIREETHHGAFSAIRSNTEHLKGVVYTGTAKLLADRAPLEDAARQRAALEGVTTALRTELDARQVPDADAIAKSVAAVLVDGVDVTVTAKG